MSDVKKLSKPIIKKGRKELRWTLVEVAGRVMRANPVWKRQFEEIKRCKMTRPLFARYYLIRLGIGDELQRTALNPKLPHCLVSVEQFQALFPDFCR